MRQDIRLLEGEGAADYPVMRDAPLDQREQTPSVLYELHRMFRGRYLWAILLGLIGLAGGTYAGWTLAPDPTYRSTALIRVVPFLPEIIYPTDQNGALPMFEEFVEYQTRLIRNPRVIGLAMAREEWKSTGLGTADEMVIEFKEKLRADHEGGFITVSYLDPDPDVAFAAVESAMNAYYKVHSEQDARDGEELLQTLGERRTSLTNELQGLRDSVLAIANEFGSDALESTYQYKVEELHKIETRLKDVQLALAQAAANRDGANEGEISAWTKAVAEMPPEGLAAYSPPLRAQLDSRTALQEEIERQQVSLGPGHRQMKQLAFLLGQVEENIAQQVQETRATLTEQGPQAQTDLDSGMTVSIEHMRQREEQLRQLYEAAKAETEELGRKSLQIHRLQDEASIVERQLDDTRRRIEKLSVEMANSGRVQIVSNAQRPAVPYQDTRLERASLGGLGGMLLGIGFIALLGFLDQRLHSPTDTRYGLSQIRLLGILPHLPEDLADPDQATLASHSVHHIRAMLQIGVARNHGRIFTVTSSTPGDGKTSLCLALGLSFAEADARTLLIDCDLIGHGLSSRARSIVRQKIGRVLERQGLITHDQLTQALALATSSGRRLGEVLIELDYLTSEQLRDALHIQEVNSLGLIDAMAGEPFKACIATTGTPNLDLLPVGSAEAKHASRLAPNRLRQLLDTARKHYDVVLVDTGPMSGSIEASLMAAETDATILVVSRGAPRAQVERAVTQLQTVNAQIAGLVFNRALEPLLFSGQSFLSLSRTSMSQRFSSSRSTPVPTDDQGEWSRFGPIAGALSQKPEHTNGNAKADHDKPPATNGHAKPHSADATESARK